MKRITVAKESNKPVIIGISTPMKDYRLTWFMNKALNFKLAKQKDISIFNEKKEKLSSFSFYCDEQPENMLVFYFISNRNAESEVLTYEQKQTDFIFLIKGALKKTQLDEIIQNIKSISNIQTAFLIDNSTFKNLDSLMEDIELHLLDVLKAKKQSNIKVI
jgi:hypothetical protein